MPWPRRLVLRLGTQFFGGGGEEFASERNFEIDVNALTAAVMDYRAELSAEPASLSLQRSTRARGNACLESPKKKTSLTVAFSLVA